MSIPLKELARLIPMEYWREIMDLKMIDQAVAMHGNETMHYLGVIWKNYIEPDFTPDCGLCYTRVLNGFKQMAPYYSELKSENNFLDAI
jgi:hypothetical protein